MCVCVHDYLVTRKSDSIIQISHVSSAWCLRLCVCPLPSLYIMHTLNEPRNKSIQSVGGARTVKSVPTYLIYGRPPAHYWTGGGGGGVLWSPST